MSVLCFFKHFTLGLRKGSVVKLHTFQIRREAEQCTRYQITRRQKARGYTS